MNTIFGTEASLFFLATYRVSLLLKEEIRILSFLTSCLFMTVYLLLALAMHLNSDFRSDHTIYSAKSVFYVD